MHRVLRLWALLFPAFLLADQLTAIVGFRHLDLTFERFVAIAVVPLLQAILLVGLSRHSLFDQTPAGARSKALVHDRRARRLLAALVILDLALLELAWWPAGMPVAKTDRFALLGLVTAALALTASAVALRLAAARSTMSERTPLLVIALFLCGASAALPFDWIGVLAARLDFALPAAAVHLLLVALSFAVAVAYTAALQRKWEESRPLATRLLDFALAGAVMLALVVALNRFWHPTLPPFWSQVADSLELGVAGAILASLVVVWRRWEEPRTATSQPAAGALHPPGRARSHHSPPATAGAIAIVGSYLLARVGASIVVTGSVRWSLESTMLLAVVPSSQIALLAIARAHHRRRFGPETDA